MKKLIMRMYGVACILFFFLFLYGMANLRISLERTEKLNGYAELVNYTVSEVEDADAPLGEKKVIRFRAKDIQGDYNTLFFLAKHQDVRVYVKDELIYELTSGEGPFCPKTPGVVYNDIALKEDYNYREIVIELVPHVRGVNPTPNLKFGARDAIIAAVIYENFPVILLCSIVLAMGVLQLCVAFINRNQQTFGVQPAVCHAISVILVGAWKIFDSNLMALQGQKYPIFPLLAVLIFITMPIMIAKAVRDQIGTEKSMPWVISDWVTIACIVSMLILQLAGIQDVWNSMWLTRANLMVMFLCTVFAIRAEVAKNGWTKGSKTGAVVAFFALIWVIVDIITYYVAGGVTEAPFGMLLFVVFMGILVANRMQISKKSMEEGMQARQYSKLAFHDALTGFFNRAAFMDYVSSSEFLPERSIVLAFDLNNLKKCNDELGHDKGDQYIKESANIIMDCFGEGGRCYRLGGDEFSAILEKPDVRECEKRIQLMNERVERFNQNSSDIRMGIACGYALFDPKEDEDIHATVRRADKMMYEVKFAMKKKLESDKEQ